MEISGVVVETSSVVVAVVVATSSVVVAVVVATSSVVVAVVVATICVVVAGARTVIKVEVESVPAVPVITVIPDAIAVNNPVESIVPIELNELLQIVVVANKDPF